MSGYDWIAVIINAAYAKWILCFVFGAVGNFVIKRTKAKGTISIRFAGLILHKMAKYLCEWL